MESEYLAHKLAHALAGCVAGAALGEMVAQLMPPKNGIAYSDSEKNNVLAHYFFRFPCSPLEAFTPPLTPRFHFVGCAVPH